MSLGFPIRYGFTFDGFDSDFFYWVGFMCKDCSFLMEIIVDYRVVGCEIVVLTCVLNQSMNIG